MEQATAKPPMVSVAMIAYNKAGVIADAIKGVVKQKTDFPFELIIVDDLSTDNTYNIAAEWAERYPEIIKLYRNSKNIGLQRNYLEAFSHCKGKYLAICDADDYWFCDKKLATQVKYMESNPDCAITFHRVVNYYEADNSKSLSNGGQQADTSITELSRSNFITNLSVVYRKNLVDLSQLPIWITDDKSPDYALHMLYASHGKIHYFSKPMGVYRISSGSSWSMTEKFEKLKMSLIVREHLMDTFAGQQDIIAGLEQATINILLHMIIAAENDNAKIMFARKRLMNYGNYSDESITSAINRIRTAKPSLKKRLLTPARIFVSRFIPLPCI